MRTFVAVDLDPVIKDSLADLITRIGQEESGVRWVKRQGMHITLKFFGEVAESKILNMSDAIRKACDSLDSFHLSFTGTGFFPPQSRVPRVLWVGIAPSPDLANLHMRIEDEFRKLGFPKEKRRFHPHLTLGRVKSNKEISAILERLNDYRDSNFGRMHVERVTLFKSILKPTGAEYEVLSETPLT